MLFCCADEWMGISPDNEGSCQFFLRHVLTGPLNIPERNIHFFYSLSADPEKKTNEADRFIKEKGPIDLMLVGVGRNGHIGFNEPGVPFDKYYML